jgi:hypothetical protein
MASGEFAEIMVRNAFTPTKEVAIWRALQPAEKEAAKERQGARTDLRESFPKVGEQRARDKVAAFVGKYGRTLEKQVAVVEASEADPEAYGNWLRTWIEQLPWRSLAATIAGRAFAGGISQRQIGLT